MKILEELLLKTNKFHTDGALSKEGSAFKQNRVILDALVITFGIICARFSSFLFRYLAMRLLSVEQYGQLSLFISWFVVLLQIVCFHSGHALAVVFSKAISTEERGSWLVATFGLSLTMSLFAAPLAIVGAPSGLVDWAFLPLIFLSLLSISTVVIGQGVVRGLLMPFAISTLEWAITSGRLLLLACLFLIGSRSKDTPLIAFLFGPMLGIGLALYYLRRPRVMQTITDIRWKDVRKRLIELFHFSGYIVLAAVGTFGMQYVSRWSLSALGYERTAIYDASMMIYSIIQIAFAGVGLAVVPYASQEGREFLSKWSFAKFLWLYLPVGIIELFLAYTNLGPVIFRTVGLDGYIPALAVFKLLILVAPIELIFVSGFNILIGWGRTREYFEVVLMALPFHFIGVWLGARIWGEMGVAFIRILTFSFMAWQVTRRLGKKM